MSIGEGFPKCICMKMHIRRPVYLVNVYDFVFTYALCVHIYLVNLGLQAIVKRPGLLELLVELIHLLLMLLFQTLPLLLKLQQILEARHTQTQTHLNVISIFSTVMLPLNVYHPSVSVLPSDVVFPDP